MNVTQEHDVSPAVRLPDPFAMQGNRMMVTDRAYHTGRKNVIRCLRLLPEYAASLTTAGHKAEADRLKCLAYDMAAFWQEGNLRSNMETPDVFLSRFEKAEADAENTGQSRILTSQEQKTIRKGFQSHIIEIADDFAAVVLHLHKQYTELAGQITLPQDLETMPETAALSDREKVARCLRLIPGYAASLSAAGREAEIGRWKCLAYNMALFWYDYGQESPKEFLNRFEKTIADAAASGRNENLSRQDQALIRTGVQTHMTVMLRNPPEAAAFLMDQYKELIETTRSLQIREEQITGEKPSTSTESTLPREILFMKEGFDLMCKYAAARACSGEDVGEFRTYAVEYASYWGVQYCGDEYENLENHFDGIVSGAIQSGNAPQVSGAVVSCIIKLFRIYEQDMRIQDDEKSDEYRTWISDVRRFANRLDKQNRAEQKREQPDVPSQAAEAQSESDAKVHQMITMCEEIENKLEIDYPKSFMELVREIRESNEQQNDAEKHNKAKKKKQPER